MNHSGGSGEREELAAGDSPRLDMRVQQDVYNNSEEKVERSARREAQLDRQPALHARHGAERVLE